MCKKLRATLYFIFFLILVSAIVKLIQLEKLGDITNKKREYSSKVQHKEFE